MGNRHPPHGVYPCQGEDEWMALACRSDDDWAALCHLIGSGLEPKADLQWRQKEHNSIDETISSWTAIRSKTQAANDLQEAGISAGPVNTTPDMTADDQVKHRGFFVPLDGNVPMPGNPVKMSGTSTEDWKTCPALGADNVQILKDWLGYSDAQIADLVKAGVLNSRPPA